MPAKVNGKHIFKTILDKFNISYDLDPKLYETFCEQVKHNFKNNWRVKVDMYVPIFIKRGLTENLMEVVLEATSINAVTKYKFLLVYGEDWGLIKWNEYCNRQSETNSLEYKSKKYGMTSDGFSDYNKSRAVTLDNMIFKYGEIEGNIVYNDYVSKQVKTKSKDYVVDKYGIEKWDTLCKSKAHTLENYIKRYGNKNMAIEKLEEFFSNLASNSFYSKISQELFWSMDSKILDKHGVSYFFEKNFEFTKYSEFIQGCYKYDYVIPEYKFAIEFNGDYYHANPVKYSPDFYITKVKKYARDVWKEDEIKVNFLKSFGYEVLVIWEKDFRENKQYTIDRVVNYVELCRNK